MIDPNLLAAFDAKSRELGDRELCEESLYEFLKRAWKYIDPAPFVGGWHLEAIAEHLQAVTDGHIRRLIVNVPPRSSKSSIVSVAWPAWTWAQSNIGPCSGPQVQFLSASYAQTLSLRDSVKNRRLIESPWYKRHWGNRFKMTGDVNTKGRFENDHGGYRLATSVDGALTGEGGQCFPSGTKIYTPSGEKCIENIGVNDYIYAYDEMQQRVVISRIVATQSRYADELYQINTVAGHSFRCTGNHPVYSPGRGFVRADTLGPGDWLLRASTYKKGSSPKDDIASDLCGLRSANKEVIVRDQKGAEAAQSRRLLFGNVQAGALCRQGIEALYNLWRSQVRSPLQVLFREVQKGWQSAAENSNLSSLWDRISKLLQNILQFDMRRFGSFGTNAREWKFKIQGNWEVFEPIYSNGRIGACSGWPSLCGVRSSGWINANAQVRINQEEIEAASPSYGRKYKEQYSRESDSALHFLSQEAPSWDFDRVASITVDCNAQYLVHDIQVGRWCNFFAEGILVHNCIIVDDPHNATEVESDLVRTSTLQWWDEAMSTRLSDPQTGAYVIIMQRLHHDDLTGHIIRREQNDWVWLCLPMEHEIDRHCITYIGNEKFWEDPRKEDGELLCQQRFPRAAVDNLKRRMPPFSVAGQLQQLPVPRGGGIIKEEWWGQYLETTYPPFEFILASLDTAYTEKEENDPSALTIWGVYRNENNLPRIMLIYGWQDRLTLPDLIERVHATCTTTNLPDTSKYKYSRRFRVDRLLIESKASGISVYQELQRVIGFNTSFSIELFNPTKLGDKQARVYSIQHLFSEGLVYVPWPVNKDGEFKGKPADTGYKWAEEIIDQVTVFPRGSHEDLVDTLSQALRWLRDSGVLQRSEEYAFDAHEEMVYKGRPKPLYPV